MWSTTLLGLTVSLGSVARAHVVFADFYINEVSVGDGTCLRMPHNPSTCTNPIASITSTDMACGVDGNSPVAYTCPAPAGAKITFEARRHADASQPSTIDKSHRGPCAVYLKKVDDMQNDSAAGDGWFKIWERGYDQSSGKFCVDQLIEDNGLLSVNLPTDLPTGYYLVRPEVLALHAIPSDNNPQFYVGCAQIFVEGDNTGSLDIPSNKKVSIPGYVSASDPGLNYNIYETPLPAYPIPGPEVWAPTYTSSSSSAAISNVTFEGAVPDDCLIVNGNWCGREVDAYSTQDGCWAAVDACYRQEDECYDQAPPSGNRNCKVWDGRCKQIQDACNAGDFTGPPDMGVKLKSAVPGAPGAIPAASPPTTDDSSDGQINDSSSTTTTTTSAPAKASTSTLASGSSDEYSSGLGLGSGSGNSPTTPAITTVASAPAKAGATSTASGSSEEYGSGSDSGFDTSSDSPASDDEQSSPTVNPNDQVLPSGVTPFPIFATPSAPIKSSLAPAPGSGSANPPPGIFPSYRPSGASARPLSTGTPGTQSVSHDGQCGRAMGQTCAGSVFGGCCSKMGVCGSGKVHCGCGCQKGFGLCRE